MEHLFSIDTYRFRRRVVGKDDVDVSGAAPAVVSPAIGVVVLNTVMAVVAVADIVDVAGIADVTGIVDVVDVADVVDVVVLATVVVADGTGPAVVTVVVEEASTGAWAIDQSNQLW